ncbi:proline iminopeptidase-family hydrolase [Flavihumibacter stibioxidans]|uniref:proline iminopeptidase-family hydrolase n=1 Tax=Flavihumibacter stibioxidans TaxID=1834163 RepID=UPI00164F73DE|nr:proline iminopeptidase-family hydrolase [Flavihumibacter stibioxidans]
MIKHATVYLLLFFAVNGYTQTLRRGEGYVQVEGGRIWYKVVGKGKGTPLLLIHGGPGSRSCSGMAEYSLLADERPVIFYDQLGSGKSDRPTDTSLWRVSRFANEIDHLRKALGLKKLHILGHSWGGAVLVEYMVTKKPKGVASAIFSSPLLSTPAWMNDARILVNQLPASIRDTIFKYEALKDYQAPSYLVATDSFYARHLSVKQWPPAPSAECDGVPGFNAEVYNYMWGPTEFTATGTLVNFDRTDRLHEIKQPVLFVTGEFDEARPETISHFHQLVPHSKLEIIKNAGHRTARDQTVSYISVLRQFMQSVQK